VNAIVRILRFLRGHRLQIAVTVLFGLAAAGSNIGLLATAALLIASAALKPALLALSFPMYLVRVLGVSRAFLRYGERLVSHRMTFTLLTDLRVWFFGRLEPLAPARLLEYRSGDLLARLAKDIDELENVYVRAVSPITVALLTALIVCVAFAFFSPVLAAAAAIVLLLAAVGIPLLTRTLARQAGSAQPALRAALTTQLVDGIQGLQDLLAFGQEDAQQRRMAALTLRGNALERRLGIISGLRSGLSELLQYLAVWIILLLAIPLIHSGAVRGVYLAFLALLMLSTFDVVTPVGQAMQTLDRSAAAGVRLFAVADALPTVVDCPFPQPRIEGIPSLIFDHVTFAYRPDIPPAVEDISFCLPPGGRVAIVGASGSGKSTLARLAVRIWDPDSGHILLDGAPLNRYALDDLRTTFGLVAQDTYIFTDTLRNNLLLANPQATEAALLQALQAVQLDELLTRLPQGLDTLLGEQGGRISGGERRRVAIARALLQDAPILLLDEATANLDTVTEQALLETIFASLGEKSLLAITHRLVGMEHMDQILVLDHGRLIEQGGHADLLAAHGVYRQLFDAQRQLLALV
jgi:ATP-binding cassette subfamily C protein CydC